MFFVSLEVVKEVEKKLKVMWQDKGREIESRFKELFQPSQPASKFTKARKPKVQQKKENKELSSYPGSLMREFFVKVSLQM